MATRSKLIHLQERVRRAEGADREIDATLWWAFTDHAETDAEILDAADRSKGDIAKLFDGLFCGWRNSDWVPPYTASLDSALRLVEEKLPGANIHLSWVGGKWRPGYTATALIAAPYSGLNDDEDGKPRGKGGGKGLPLAILDALLTALIEQGDRRDG